MKKYILKFSLLLFIYCIGQSITAATAFDCMVYFLLMGILIKDEIKKLWYMAIGEEV